MSYEEIRFDCVDFYDGKMSDDYDVFGVWELCTEQPLLKKHTECEYSSKYYTLEKFQKYLKKGLT